MRVRVAAIVGVLLLWCLTGWSQNRLSEVAGGIQLNPDAVVEKGGYVDDPGAVLRADRELLEATLAGCSAAAEVFVASIEEVETSFPEIDPALPDRIVAAAADLEGELSELDSLRLTPALTGPLTAALDAADLCNAATEDVRQRLEKWGAAMSLSAEQAMQCRASLGEARRLLGEVPDDPTAAAAAPAGVSRDDEIIAAACAEALSRDFEAGEACEDRQYDALALLTARTADIEGVPADALAEVRRVCRDLHPGDFVERNLCETEKLMPLRLETQ